MPRVAVPDIIESASKIKHTWTSNPTFALGDVKLDAFTAAHASVVDLDTIITAKRHELQGLLDQRDDKAKALQDLSTRALSGFRAVFGPDSPQYDQAGGTRRSQRQSRRPAAAKA